MSNTYFFCSNRYAKTLSEQEMTFRELSKQFSVPFVSMVKDGLGIFPGHYTDCYRELQYIDYHNLLAIDIDSHEQSLKLLDHVQNRNEYLYKYNFIVYSTFSSVKSALRLRLLVDIYTGETIERRICIDDYTPATRTLENKLELAFDPASHKRNSFVYTPRIKPTTDFVFFHHITGGQFERSDIDDNFRKRITLAPKAKDDFSEYVNSQDSSTYDSEYIPDDILEAMVRAIPPDCDYNTWMRVISGIHHYSDGAMWGYELVNAWSAEGEKYDGRDELWYKWNSIKDETETPVTIGTVIHIANQYNWHAKRMDNIAKKLKGDIIDNKEKFFDQAHLDEFCKRVSKYTFSSLTRAEIVHDILDAVCEVKGITKVAIKKQHLKHIEDRCKFGGLSTQRSDEDRRNRMPQLFNNFVFITGMSNDVLIADITQPIDPEKGSKLKTFNQFNVEHRHFALYDGENVAGRLLDEYRLPHAESIKFAPDCGSIFEDQGHMYVNSYVRDETFTFRKYEQFSAYQKQLFQDITSFMEYFIPQPKERLIFLNFMAYNIFYVGKKILWSPLLISIEGYGKDTVMALYEAALGKHKRYYLKIEGENFFDTQWTARLEHRSHIYVNEVYILSKQGNDMTYKTYNSIKDLITGVDNLRISAKYQHDRTISQVTNYSFSSNNKDCMVYPPTERRLFVLFLDDRHDDLFGDKSKVGPALTRIWQALTACGIQTSYSVRNPASEYQQQVIREVLLAYFDQFAHQSSWDADFRPSGHAHHTPEFESMSRNSTADFVFLLEDFMDDTDYAYYTPYYACLSTLERDVLDQYKAQNIKYTISRQLIANYLKSKGYVDIRDLRSQIPIVGERVDVGRALPGTHVGKSHLMVSPSGARAILEMRLSNPQEITTTLYSKYRKDLALKEFEVQTHNTNETQDSYFN